MRFFLGFVLVGLLAVSNAVKACEYANYDEYHYVPLYRPVISGINTPVNVIKQWSFLKMEDLGWFYDNFYHGDSSQYTDGRKFMCYEGYSCISIERNELNEVHFPLTVYISLLGTENGSTASLLRTIGYYNGAYPVEELRYKWIVLQYRSFPSTNWITAGVMIGRDIYGYEVWASKLAYEDILRASLPDKNSFAMMPEKSFPVFGSYTIDIDVPQGTLVQLRLLTAYDRIDQVTNNYIQAVTSPANYYADPPTRLIGTNGDWITVTASGKRRPRHDQ